MRSFVLFLALLAFALPASAESLSLYRRAFSALDAGRYDEAFRIGAGGRDSALNTVLTGYAMARPGNPYSFNELARFISDHPSWPNIKDIVSIAEQILPSNATPQQIVNWFQAYPPQTLAGFYRYYDALDTLGQAKTAQAAVKDYWIRHTFAADEMTAFYGRFSPLLSPADHRARLDRLLWAGAFSAARTLFPYVSPGQKALAEARIALASQKKGAESYVARVPASLRSNAGLLYERARWRRKNNLDDGAIDILLHAPERLGRPDKWWDERSILARRAMEKHDFRLAYRLIQRHGLSSGFDFSQAEFLSGWLALRFLNKPAQALRHFQALYDGASTPITQARGAYWLGRAYEALGQPHEAEQQYETAAAFNTTFYGQIAATRLFAKPEINAAPEPAIPPFVRNRFFANLQIQAIQKLAAIDEPALAKSFFKASVKGAARRVEFVLLMELAYRLQHPDWAIQAAKAANQKNMIVTAAAYPVLDMRLPSEPEPALTHALIRQESLFNADAGSSVGARGLMQLMPGTARDVARKLGVAFKPSDLTEPSKNIRLGTAFIQHQIDSFDGSYVLSLAGYNAGPRRVREWMALFGDPRSASIDPVDWIELMPIYETRNYVQRIIENLQFYRARLAGGRAPLRILQDLKR